MKQDWSDFFTDDIRQFSMRELSNLATLCYLEQNKRLLMGIDNLQATMDILRDQNGSDR